MAIFLARVKTIARSRGKSSVQAAAYRAGCALRDERTGVTHNYSRKAGVLEVILTAPPGSPAYCAEPGKLWNAAEELERINGTPARELLIALPPELSQQQRSNLARAVADYLVNRYRVATMTAIHAPDRRGDQRNFHAHIMLTTREVGPGGFGKKTRALDARTTGPQEVAHIREAVARLTNEHLARAGLSVRINHRSLKQQSLDAEQAGDFATAIRFIRAPVKHEGQAATAARRRGEWSPAAEQNARIRTDNAALQKSFVSKIRSIATPIRSHVSGVAWATGHDADLLNGQAQSLQDTIRMEADMSHAYQSMLADVIRDLGSRAAPVIDYAQLQELSIEAARELVTHAKNNAKVPMLARKILRADHARSHAEGLDARRRKRYTKAMVRTADAARELRLSEDRGPRNKREWAQLRRDQQAALSWAQKNEQRAESLIQHEATYRAKARAQAARDRILALEAERRRLFPISGETARPEIVSSNRTEKPLRAPLDWIPPQASPRKNSGPRLAH